MGSYSNELYHYGVLGMRWGVRRARKMEQKSETLRKRGKIDKANALKEKSKKILAKHERLSGGKEVVDRVTGMSTGKAIAQSLVMGTYGSLKYNQARTKGVDKGKAAIQGILLGNINTWTTGGIVGIVAPRVAAKRKEQSGR